MKFQQISYVPGFFKIFDEILVNAADNKVRFRFLSLLSLHTMQVLGTDVMGQKKTPPFGRLMTRRWIPLKSKSIENATRFQYTIMGKVFQLKCIVKKVFGFQK
jgi:hypothetical protein